VLLPPPKGSGFPHRGIIMNLVQCSGDEMDLFTRTGDNGTIYHGFGCYGGIAGIPTVSDAADENGEGESGADLCDADDNDGLDENAAARS